MYKTSSAILFPAREIHFDAIHRFKGIVQPTFGPSDETSQGLLQSFYSLKVLLKALKSLAHFVLQVRIECVHTEHHFCSIHYPAYLSASLATFLSQEHLSYIYLPVACILHVHVQHLQYLTLPSPSSSSSLAFTSSEIHTGYAEPEETLELNKGKSMA